MKNRVFLEVAETTITRIVLNGFQKLQQIWIAEDPGHLLGKLGKNAMNIIMHAVVK